MSSIFLHLLLLMSRFAVNGFLRRNWIKIWVIWPSSNSPYSLKQYFIYIPFPFISHFKIMKSFKTVYTRGFSLTWIWIKHAVLLMAARDYSLSWFCTTLHHCFDSLPKIVSIVDIKSLSKFLMRSSAKAARLRNLAK